MRRKWRLAIVGMTAVAVTASLAPVVLRGPDAAADVSGNTFATTTNASDPHIIKCNDPDNNNVAGYCLYTSQDMGQQFVLPANCLPSSCDNYYPMVQTRVYFSQNAYTNWVYKGIAWEEWKMDVANGGFVPVDSRHLWAPSAARVPNGNGTYTYWLYLPDVADKSSSGVHTSSRIAVLSSDNPFRNFTFRGTLPYSSGYMSDPDVLVLTNSSGAVTDRLVVWADGDYNTCGGFKWARLNSDMLTFATTPAAINFSTASFVTPISTLSDDCLTAGVRRPYVEGASLYKKGFDNLNGWTLLFAAKPDHVPTECTEANAPGQSNSNHEVIAWASSTGPPAGGATWVWDYESIVMCGSSTEWTNQATITSTPNGRAIIIYHDGPAPPNRQRKLHAECLFSGGGIIAGVWRQPLASANGFNDCTAGTSGTNLYGALHVRDAQYLAYPPIASAIGGTGDLAIRRYAVGPYERFRIEPVAPGSTTITIRSLQNGKYVCEPSPRLPLAPACTSATDNRARFVQTGIGMFGTFRLRSVLNNNYVDVYGDAKNPVKSLYASSATMDDAAIFTYLTPNRSNLGS